MVEINANLRFASNNVLDLLVDSTKLKCYENVDIEEAWLTISKPYVHGQPQNRFGHLENDHGLVMVVPKMCVEPTLQIHLTLGYKGLRSPCNSPKYV